MKSTPSAPGSGVRTKVSGVCSRWSGFRLLRVAPKWCTFYLSGTAISCLILADLGGKTLEKLLAHGERCLDIFGAHRLGVIVADPAGAAQKEHGRRHAARHDHGIVSGSA